MSSVQHHRAEQEYTIDVGGQRAVAAYQREGDVVVFTHTVVPPEIEGRGVGGRLVRRALDDVRDQGLKVIPQCPFVRAWIDKHPVYRDLVA